MQKTVYGFGMDNFVLTRSQMLRRLKNLPGKKETKHRFIEKQLLLAMKITSFFLIVLCLHVSARTNSQSITLAGKDLQLQQIFSSIKEQTGFVIFGTADLVSKAKPVSVSATNMPLADFLSLVLKDQQLQYMIADNTIIIFRKSPDADILFELPEPPQNITGRVTDSLGNPVESASVRLTPGNKGASTRADGTFVITSVKPGSYVLEISFVGYEVTKRSVTVAENNALEMPDIILKPTLTGLSDVEIVSTGYQKIKRERLTGSVSSINSETYHQSIPVTGNILTNLEGRLPGLVYNPNTGDEKGGGLSIRGVSTLNADSKPLIILNGFPTEIDLDNIEPSDIESIDVLKDAAAAAIYGVRSSNGVIIITTKKGQAGELKFHFNTSVTTQSKPDFSYYQYLTGSDYIEAERLKTLYSMSTSSSATKLNYDSKFINYTPVFGITDDLNNGRITQEEAEKLYAQYAAYNNTEDYKRLFLQNPLLTTVDLDISGGTKNVQYLFGVSHQNNRLGRRLNSDNRTVINYHGSFRFLNRFSLDVQSFYTNSNHHTAPSPSYSEFRPYLRFEDENGNPLPDYFQRSTALTPFISMGSVNDAKANNALSKGLFDPRYYPLKEITGTRGHNQGNIFHFQGNLTTNLFHGLKLEVGGMYERQLNTLSTIKNEDAYETRMALNLYTMAEPTTGLPVFQFPLGGTKSTTNNHLTSYTLRAQLNYQGDFGDHRVTALFGGEKRRIETSNLMNTVFGYDPNTLIHQQMNLSLFNGQEYASPFKNEYGISGGLFSGYSFSNFVNETYVDNRFVSSYGNVAYTYHDKYTATGSFRIDQSNLFGTDPKFRYVPLWSAGVLWALQKESFLNNVGWLSRLNLRASVGYNGNTASGAGPFTTIQAQRNILAQPNPIIGYVIKSPLNNSLRWEKTLNYNLGVDVSILNGRLFSTIDYYIKKSRDLIEMMNIDPTVGGNGTGVMANNASINNKGLEIAVNSINIRTKRFSWLTQMTASFNSNRVIDLNYDFNVGTAYHLIAPSSANKVEGYPLNPLFAYRYAGLNELGQPTMYLQNGKTVVLDANSNDPDTVAVYQGTTVPKYVLGLNNQISFHHFDLNFLLMYYGGHVGYMAPPTLAADRPIQGALNYWKEPGDERMTNNPGYAPVSTTDPRYFNAYAMYTYTYGDVFYKKMDYLALRNVTLSYNLDHVLKNAGLSNARIRLQVQNPAKLVFNGEHIDPETMNLKSGARALPVVKSYSISFTTNF